MITKTKVVKVTNGRWGQTTELSKQEIIKEIGHDKITWEISQDKCLKMIVIIYTYDE